MGRISSSTFVGREHELARLAALAPSTNPDAPRIALIGGDAGIGKTRLVTEFTNSLAPPSARRVPPAVELAETPTQVLTGGCLQLGEAASPLAPITEVLRTLIRERGEDDLRHLLTGPRRALLGLMQLNDDTTISDNSSAAQLHEAVLSLFETLGTEGPLLAVLEDLHWAAPATRDLVTFLAHNPPAGPVLLVLTYRADDIHAHHPLRPTLAELTRLRAVERIDLTPLTEAEQRQQAEDILGRPLTDTETHDLTSRAEGNAFYAEELLAANDSAHSLPATLREVLASRLAALPETAQEVVRVAAAAGRVVDHRLLGRVADLDGHGLDIGLRTATERGLLVPEGHHYRFRHALLQEAAYDGLLPGERLRLHRALAETLSQHRALAADGTTGADAEIAHHAEQSMLHDLAYTASLAAADHAQATHAYDETLRHLERALALRGSCAPGTLTAGPARVELLQRAGRVATEAGHSQQAIGLLQTALAEETQHASRAQTADLFEALAAAQRQDGDGAGSAASTVRAVEVAPPSSPQLARALARRAIQLAVGEHNPREAEEPGRAALELARELGDAEQEVFALFSFGTMRGFLGTVDEGAELLRTGIDLAVQNNLMEWATRCHINLGAVLAGAGRLDEAHKSDVEWIRYAEAHDLTLKDVDFLRLNHVDNLVLKGWVAEAAAAFAKVRRRTNVFDLRHYVTSGGDLYLTQARFADAANLRQETRELLPGISEPQFALPLAELDAHLELVGNRYDAAWHVLDEARSVEPNPSTAELIRPLAARVEADRLTHDSIGEEERNRSLGRLDMLRADLEEMLAGAVDSPSFTAHLNTALAQVAAERTRAEGKPDPDAWLAAEEGVAEQGRVPEVAYLRIRRAEALIGLDRRDEATDLLRQTHADCVERGMAWCAQQAEAVAKRARIKLPGVGGPSADPFGLTDRERDVLALLTEGLTNPQIGELLFISDKTASVHVSHILTKLNAGNRNQAAAIARDHGLDTG